MGKTRIVVMRTDGMQPRHDGLEIPVLRCDENDGSRVIQWNQSKRLVYIIGIHMRYVAWTVLWTTRRQGWVKIGDGPSHIQGGR